MKAELELRYRAENIQIKSNDNYILDAMYLPAEEEEPGINTEPEYGPTVIICCPSDGYYEYAIETQDYWIEFYKNNGINILFWNYRGYGRSQGYPNPKNILEDGESVLKYLRDVKGSGRIILHGEGLGVAVAVNIAAKLGCDMLFSIRGFYSLYPIIEMTAGTWVAKLAKNMMGWDIKLAEDFISVPCYKIVTSDPNDSVIPEGISLKNKIAEFTALANSINGKLALTDNEIYIFYKNLENLYDMINDFNDISKKILKKKRKIERPKSQDITNSCEVRVRTSSDGEIETYSNSIQSSISTTNDIIMNNTIKIPSKYINLIKNDNFDDIKILVDILDRINMELGKLDAAGTTIGKIMKDKKAYRKKLLTGFLYNLDVWGSQPPARLEGINEPLSTLVESRIRAYVNNSNNRAK